jgi:hypothetical protein
LYQHIEYSSATWSVSPFLAIMISREARRKLERETMFNQLLQEVTWETVLQQPLSGVRLDAQP